MTFTVQVLLDFNPKVSLTVSLKVRLALPERLSGAIKLGWGTSDLDRVTGAPSVCSQRYEREESSRSVDLDPSSVTMVHGLTACSGPASATGG